MIEEEKSELDSDLKLPSGTLTINNANSHSSETTLNSSANSSSIIENTIASLNSNTLSSSRRWYQQKIKKRKEISIAREFVSSKCINTRNPKSSGLFRTNINNKK